MSWESEKQPPSHVNFSFKLATVVLWAFCWCNKWYTLLFVCTPHIDTGNGTGQVL